MWTPDGSLACDQERHKDCDGVAIINDQDGASRYVCGCWCHKHDACDDTCQAKAIQRAVTARNDGPEPVGMVPPADSGHPQQYDGSGGTDE